MKDWRIEHGGGVIPMYMKGSLAYMCCCSISAQENSARTVVFLCESEDLEQQELLD